MNKHYTKWSEKDEEILMELYKNKINHKEIARVLGRTLWAIDAKIIEIKNKRSKTDLVKIQPATEAKEDIQIIRDIKKYIESMLTPTHINDAIIGDNSRLKDKNKKLKAALTEAKNIIEEALKDEPISSNDGGTTVI